MMKFFRKHNKTLLAIFMVLLMIVFLGGSALDSFFRPSGNRVVATSKWGSISYLDQRVADDTTDILAALGMNWQQPLPGATEPLETTDWILLLREAQQLGTVSNPAQVRSFLEDSLGIDNLGRQLRIKPARILQAMAEFSSIQQTALAVSAASAPSEAAVLSAARKALEKVQFNAVLLPATAFMEEDVDAAEDQIEAHFAAYREREVGPGLEFGYYVPPAIKVQYIKINRDVLAETVGVANLEKKAKAYYDERREWGPAFKRPPEETTSEDEPVEGPPYEPPPYLVWEEASQIAEQAVREKEADEAVARIADWLVQYTAELWLAVERGEDGYKTPPGEVATLDYYEGIIDNVPRAIAYPEAVSTATTDFFSEDEASDVPGIGKALFVSERVGSYETFPALAFRTKAIVPTIPDKKGTNRSDYLAEFQTCRYPLRDSEGNVFVFRVVDAREGHTPKSVDEVRDRVLADLRLLQGYEAAKARAESLRSCSSSMSLQEAYESDEELVSLKETEGGIDSGYFELPPTARVSRFQAMSGPRRAGVMETPVAVAEINTLPTEVIDECFALEEADGKTKVVELWTKATVMVVEWLETQRVKADEFDEMRETFADQMLGYHSQETIREWLKPENIRARNGFALVTNQ